MCLGLANTYSLQSLQWESCGGSMVPYQAENSRSRVRIRHLLYPRPIANSWWVAAWDGKVRVVGCPLGGFREKKDQHFEKKNLSTHTHPPPPSFFTYLKARRRHKAGWRTTGGQSGAPPGLVRLAAWQLQSGESTVQVYWWIVWGRGRDTPTSPLVAALLRLSSSSQLTPPPPSPSQPKSCRSNWANQPWVSSVNCTQKRTSQVIERVL
jgi:hypothetical protein